MYRGVAILAVMLLWSCRPAPDRWGECAEVPIELSARRLAAADARTRGRALFLAHCALCHGTNADGRGVRREGFTRPPRDFTDPAWRRTATPCHLYTQIQNGIPGTPMPGWQATLAPEDIADLVAYLLSVGEQ